MTTSSPLDVLKAARELLSDPAKWTKHDLAKGASGRAVDVYGRSACAFCSVGAIARAVGQQGREYGDARDELCRTLASDHGSTWWHTSVTEWNDQDERTHAEVLDLFDRTIARLEAQS